MVEIHLYAEKFSVLLLFTMSLIVSYQATAFTRNEELELLSQALEQRYNTADDSVFDRLQDDDDIPTDKRYARLSYNYGNTNRGGRRYFSSRYYANYYQPWLNMKDNECFRQKCQRNSDCCRRYSKCDESAKICYSCWYGHPCKTSRDCCEDYPKCHLQQKMCTS